ncbi:cation diffusion facilitator family transporter [Pontibacillus salicampi]|uniref:Cation diffusion facilitator family transporter n=1 Tax=Pontibacillus salicampi TaxID=1449801 RepID=A0ABV6LMY9_9BACI
MEDQSWKELWKKGNKSSLAAASGNLVITIAKAFGAYFSGSGAMLATTLHSLADTVNQGFVFVGSVLAEKAPTKRFPTGFGRVINIFVMIAVLIITVLGYESIKEGWHLIQHPKSSGGFWLNMGILLLNIIIDGAILVKAMKEIVKEAEATDSEGGLVSKSLRHLSDATPPTRLVFFEDVVAVMGAILATIAVVVTTFTNFAILDGVVTLLIGVLMLIVAFRLGFENMIGLIGVSAPKKVEKEVAHNIMNHPRVEDIRTMRVVKEGRAYHVEALLELEVGLSLAEADDIKFAVWHQLLENKDISDVTLGIIESDDQKNWDGEKEEEKGYWKPPKQD